MRDNLRVDEESPGGAIDVGSVKIFMSYRRADDRHFIGRLHDRLCDAFGEEMVFRDIDSIPAGTNFRNVILRTLNEVDAVVAVIGPNWARSSATHDVADTDYVFLELAEALKQSKPMIPVLIEDTEMPSPDGLPPDLRSLSDINAISVHGDPAFRRDSTRLIEAIGAVVAENRARVARQQQEAQERSRRLEEERAGRERVAEQLRAEERAARARLAELEQAATRHQIEQERARLEDIEEQLRRAQPPADVAAASTAEPQPIVEPTPRRVPIVATPSVIERTQDPTAPRVRNVKIELPWFQILIIGALILGVVGLSLDRTVDIDGSTFQFNEFISTTTVDVMVWILTLAIAVPLLLGQRPVEQRFVLLGVVASSFVYEFLQAAASVKYGIDGFDEGSWLLVKIVELGCLVGAYRIVRKHSGELLSTPTRFRFAQVAIAIMAGILVIAATHKEWSQAPIMIENGVVPDRTPFALWVLLVALPPIAATIALAVRGTYATSVSLAALATLGVLSYFAEAAGQDALDLDGSWWRWSALSQLVLAAVASIAAITSARSVSSPA